MSQKISPQTNVPTADAAAEQTSFRLFRAALQTELPVALWRLPNMVGNQLLVAADAKPSLPPLEGAVSGFAFAPFQVTTDTPINFLPADLFFSGRKGASLEEGERKLPARFWNVFRKSDQKPEEAWPTPLGCTPRFISRDAYEQSVATAVQAMQAGHLEKVVLSRTKTLPLFEGFDLLQVYAQLTQLYPTAFISLVAIPGVGTWLGATPELLVQIDQHKTFKTVALAGTQPFTDGLTPADAIWRQKEIEEQALVQRYIISCFKHLRLRDYTEIGPRTVAAGKLLHLRTDYSAPMEALGFPALGTQMLELLHPTSAVCGMPKAAALQMISDLELHDRRYYSGYLGPVQMGQETQLFVNLRCAELGKDTVTAYAGAGLTQDSNPALEWQETELKMQTVLRLFLASES